MSGTKVCLRTLGALRVCPVLLWTLLRWPCRRLADCHEIVVSVRQYFNNIASQRDRQVFDLTTLSFAAAKLHVLPKYAVPRTFFVAQDELYVARTRINVVIVYRESLLRAKCLPPLIRMRLHFQQHAVAGINTTAECDNKHEQQQQQEHRQSRHLRTRDGISSVVEPGGALRYDGGVRHRAGQRSDRGDAPCGEDVCSVSNSDGKTPAQIADANQPSLEAMIGLLIRQLVGKT